MSSCEPSCPQQRSSNRTECCGGLVLHFHLHVVHVLHLVPDLSTVDAKGGPGPSIADRAVGDLGLELFQLDGLVFLPLLTQRHLNEHLLKMFDLYFRVQHFLPYPTPVNDGGWMFGL